MLFPPHSAFIGPSLHWRWLSDGSLPLSSGAAAVVIDSSSQPPFLRARRPSSSTRRPFSPSTTTASPSSSPTLSASRRFPPSSPRTRSRRCLTVSITPLTTSRKSGGYLKWRVRPRDTLWGLAVEGMESSSTCVRPPVAVFRHTDSRRCCSRHRPSLPRPCADPSGLVVAAAAGDDRGRVHGVREHPGGRGVARPLRADRPLRPRGRAPRKRRGGASRAARAGVHQHTRRVPLRARGGECGRARNAALLPLWRHGEPGVPDGCVRCEPGTHGAVPSAGGRRCCAPPRALLAAVRAAFGSAPPVVWRL